MSDFLIWYSSLSFVVGLVAANFCDDWKNTLGWTVFWPVILVVLAVFGAIGAFEKALS